MQIHISDSFKIAAETVKVGEKYRIVCRTTSRANNAFASPIQVIGDTRCAPGTHKEAVVMISKDFATLWTTIDPIGNVALFAGLTAGLTRAERHWTALRGVFFATIILVAAGTVGQVILDAIGIHMHSL